jgi:hypothetical protein
MKFDRIILSSDDNPKFIEFWPLVAQGWRTLFGDIEVWLALVGEPSTSRLAELKQHGHVEVYHPVPGVPMPNQSKIARYHLAAAWNDASVNMINDIDLLPLQTAYVYKLIQQRPPGYLITVGSELYIGPEAGKFTVGYLTAESMVWRTLINPLGLSWPTFVHSFAGMRVFDHKEDITRSVHHEDPDTFSDESLLRALLKFNPVPVIHAPRGYDPYTARALCRANWMFDPKKLADGTYIEAHLPRPFRQHRDKIQPLIDYLSNV